MPFFRKWRNPPALPSRVSRRLQQRKRLPTFARHFSQGVSLGFHADIQVPKNLRNSNLKNCVLQTQEHFTPALDLMPAGQMFSIFLFTRQLAPTKAIYLLQDLPDNVG
jgi:hypothetical protein